MKIIKLIFIMSLLHVSHSHAGLYKCVDENGQMGFSDVPCAQDTQQVTLKKDFDKRGFRTDFFKNPGTSDAVRCTSGACRCGSYSTEVDSNDVRQLIRSATYLETAWSNHKHAKKVKEAPSATIAKSKCIKNYLTVYTQGF